MRRVYRANPYNSSKTGRSMTTPYLLDDLKRDEGLRLQAYPDPLSGGAPWTIGYGATGPGICEGVRWTEQQALDRLAADVTAVQHQLDEKLPWWRTLDDVRQAVLCNMGFNLGVSKLLAFKNTLAAVKAGNYAQAASAMLASAWAGQVRSRAERLAQQMRTGVRA